LCAGGLGIEWGAARGISDTNTQAAQALAGNPAKASALYQVVARQNIGLTLLDRNDVTKASQSAQSASAAAAVVAAQSAVARKDFAGAIAILTANSPPPSGPALAVRAVAFIRQAQHLIASGNAPDALVLLAALSPGNAQAAALYPAALLAAAQVCMTAHSYDEAAQDLNDLIRLFPGSPQAATAHTMLAAPQVVVGTLADHLGNPIVAKVRLSSHFTALDSGSYQTTGPFYSSKTDASGNFRFAAIPLGGPYILEVFRDGGWTTLIDPSTGKPSDPVQVLPMTPADLAFIVLP
jgi:TolA-binding protein